MPKPNMQGLRNKGPSTVIAGLTLGLLLGLGGGAVAAVAIGQHSIGWNKLTPGLQRRIEARSHTSPVPGPPGPPGEPGPQGPAGRDGKDAEPPAEPEPPEVVGSTQPPTWSSTEVARRRMPRALIEPER